MDRVQTNAYTNGKTADPVEEDCTKLLFSPEFQNCETLLISEVYLLLKNRRDEDIKNGETEESEVPEVFSKTFEYTESLNNYKSLEAVSVVRNILAKSYAALHPFEIASLANLCPESADEAKKLLPSIQKKIDDDELKSLLDELRLYIDAAEV